VDSKAGLAQTEGERGEGVFEGTLHRTPRDDRTEGCLPRILEPR